MSFKGTIAWMAPEIIRNEVCSEKVDVYIIDFGGAEYKSPDEINNDKHRIHTAICHNFDHHLGGSKYIKKSVRKIKRNKRKTNRKSYRRL